MSERSPLITLSINRGPNGTKATGELNALCLGFGIFQVWLYMAVFCTARLFTASQLLPGFPYVPIEYSHGVLYSFLIMSGIFLIVIGSTNQLFLKFYVSRRALFFAAALCTLGTLLLYTSCIPQAGFTMSIVAGSIMGMGSSLLLVIWGTTFARFQFATIILNTAVASVLGIVVSVICANWVPSPISGIVTILLPLLSVPILMKLTPQPFYLREEAPIFHPLPTHRTSFCVRFGLPVFILGIVLGALRMVCVGEILPSGNITTQLILGMSCAISIVVFIIAIALTKRDMFWDTLFRCTIPIAMLGLACTPLLVGEFELLASFCIAVGYVCLEILMWVFFAGLAQEFRISPIFVFGIGRGLLELGSGIGSACTQESMMLLANYGSNLTSLTLVMLVILSVGYALLPRYRELKAIVDYDPATAPSNEISAAADHINHKEVKDALLIASSEEGQLPLNTKTQQNSDSAEAANLSEGQQNQGENAGKGSFYRRCEEISERYMLSRREKEVLFLLAKGHNATFIQDKLCVSKSTAKTHINHIYKKIDIHTQQELLNMVEDRPRPSNHPSEMHIAGGYMGGVIPADEKRAVVVAAQNAATHNTDNAPSQPPIQKKRNYRKNIFK